MKSPYFCTYFDRNYLPRAMAMHGSLRRHVGDFTLDVLCLDNETHELLTRLNLAGVRLQRLAEFEAGDEDLGKARLNRSWVEYLWTLTPTLILRAMEHSGSELVTYLDADLYFYSNPAPVFDEFGEASVMLIPHRYARIAEKATRLNGIYNVGMMTFRHDQRGLVALQWWREQCLAACHADHRDGKFGDQKYLDDWPERFEGVRVITHKGANLAPWNIAAFAITENGGELQVDGEPLVFYHFHKLDILGEKWFRSGMLISRRNLRLIYRPYLRALMEVYRQLRELQPGFAAGFSRVTPRIVLQWCLRRRLTFMRLPDSPASR